MSECIKILKDEGYITIDVAAEMVGCHRRTIQRWVDQGRLSVVDRIQYVAFLSEDEVKKISRRQGSNQRDKGRPPWGNAKVDAFDIVTEED